MGKKVRVVIADDSPLMRREIKKIIESDPGIEVVAAARDGKDAIEKTKAFEPDVVALDINMPVMDGLTSLQYIMMDSPRPVVMLSSLTQEGAITTYEALELGAVDFIAKPGGTISKNIHEVANEIIYKIKAAAGAKPQSRLRRLNSASPRKAAESATIGYGIRKVKPQAKPTLNRRILVIGQSTGGPSTIMDIIPKLPADIGAPVVIVQHMPGTFTPSFAKRLDMNCSFPFKEAEHDEELLPNHGYLAPGGKHLSFMKIGSQVKTILSPEPSDTLHRPSVDITMTSALNIYGADTIGVLLTGMGEDGADSMVKIRKTGGKTIAESEETAVVFGMPREAIERGGANYILPSYKIAEQIIKLL